MRFRHRETPERSSIRQSNDAAMGTVEAAVFRDSLPGAGSFPSGVSVGDPTEPPAQVENVAATSGLRTVLVEWDRLDGFQTVDGAGGYEVQLDTVDTFDASPRVQRTSATMASFTDLNPATTYYVRVRGVQGEDNAGEWSTSASTTTALADTADIQASAITADKIAANAVNASKLAAITMEVGKYIQSDNYDGTDVGTGDATQGFRIEAEGDAEFQDVRVRGDIDAATLISRSGEVNLITNWSFESPDLITGWSSPTPGVTLASIPYTTEWGARVLRVTCPSGGGDVEVRHDTISVVGGRSYQPTVNVAIDPSFVPMGVDFTVEVDWYDEALGFISTSSFSSGYVGNVENDFRDTLGKASTLRAPSDARYARPRWTALGVPASFTFYMDNVKFRAVSDLVGGTLTEMAHVRAGDTNDPTASGTSLTRDGLYFRVSDSYADDFYGSSPDKYGAVIAAVGDGGTNKRRQYLRLRPAPPKLSPGGAQGPTSDVYIYSGSQDGVEPAIIYADTEELYIGADTKASLISPEIDIGVTGRRLYPPYYVALSGSKTLSSGAAANLDMTTETFDSDGLHPTNTPYINLPMTCIALIDVEMTLASPSSGVERVLCGWRVGPSGSDHWGSGRSATGSTVTAYTGRSGVARIAGGDSLYFRGFFDGVAPNHTVTYQARVVLFPAV